MLDFLAVVIASGSRTIYGSLIETSCHMTTPLSPQLRQALREAFLQGQLRVQAVDPQTGQVGLHVVKDVMRHEVPQKKAIKLTTEFGQSVVATEDHSLFRYSQGGPFAPAEWPHEGGAMQAAKTGDLPVGSTLAIVFPRETLGGARVISHEIVPSRRYMYDLCVPGPENFVLSNGIVAHNSYSIGGISLDLERSSKYQGLISEASQMFDKAGEAKNRTTKHIRGLIQPRGGIGLRSAYGPNLSRGTLSPRSFL